MWDKSLKQEVINIVGNVFFSDQNSVQMFSCCCFSCLLHFLQRG